MTAPVRIEDLRGQPRRPLVKIAAGEGLATAAKLARPSLPEAEAVGPILLITEGPAETLTAWRDATRGRTGPSVYFSDALDVDVSSAEAAASDVSTMIDQTGATVVILDGLDAIPLDPPRSSGALRRMVAAQNVTLVVATATSRR